MSKSSLIYIKTVQQLHLYNMIKIEYSIKDLFLIRFQDITIINDSVIIADNFKLAASC